MILEKKICLSSRMLTVSPRHKKQALQFLPDCLLEISKQKYFNYKEQKLKSAYLIDLVHNLILKYYFKKENSFSLSAMILKDKYGYLYNYYINYLKDLNIIKLQKNYLKGSNARVYSLNDDVLINKIHRFNNDDKVLIKKYITKHLQFELDKNNIIKKCIKEKLIEDLFHVEIDYSRSIFFLDSLKNDDIDIYNRNKYSVETINQKNIFYHFDSYGRMHTNFTILKSFIRKNCLLIDGEETCEIDIKNSQPLFLSKLIKDADSRWIDQNEFNLFNILVKNGNFYQYLIDNLNLVSKEDAKNLTYKVLFGQNRPNSKSDINFIKLFPTIHNFIKIYKKEKKDYKILAHDLQKAESNLIFNQIIKKISDENSDIRIITVHDSIIVQKKWKDLVLTIFFDEIYNHFSITSIQGINI
jgi:hypothetical protein